MLLALETLGILILVKYQNHCLNTEKYDKNLELFITPIMY